MARARRRKWRLSKNMLEKLECEKRKENYFVDNVSIPEHVTFRSFKMRDYANKST